MTTLHRLICTYGFVCDCLNMNKRHRVYGWCFNSVFHVSSAVFKITNKVHYFFISILITGRSWLSEAGFWSFSNKYLCCKMLKFWQVTNKKKMSKFQLHTPLCSPDICWGSFRTRLRVIEFDLYMYYRNWQLNVRLSNVRFSTLEALATYFLSVYCRKINKISSNFTFLLPVSCAFLHCVWLPIEWVKSTSSKRLKWKVKKPKVYWRRKILKFVWQKCTKESRF